MTKAQIIDAINRKIGTNYASWTCGITADPERRKKEHESDRKNVDDWTHWRADSEQIARDVEKHFLDKGCKGGGGGGTAPNYVYVF